MAKFVVQIVEGPSQGKRLALPSHESLVMGRKPECAFVLGGDDKVSGRHCELVFEKGVLILRDLGSTNGTRVDGKKIEEIPISHGDRFMVGRIMLEVFDEDLGSPSQQMSMEIDRDLLAKTKHRSPVALLVLLLIVVAAGAGWFFLLRGGGSEGPSRGKKEVVVVPGNKLDAEAANLEGDGSSWMALAEGGEFDWNDGGGHSGQGFLMAELGGGEKGALGPSFAGTVLSDPVSVQGAVTARAWVRTQGRVRVSLRMLFFDQKPERQAKPVPEEPVDEDAPEEGAPAEKERFTAWPGMLVGSVLEEIGGGDYQLVEITSEVPPGAEWVSLALVAVLTREVTDEAEVRIDDVSLVTAEEGTHGKATAFQTRQLWSPMPTIMSVRADSPPQETLSSLHALPIKGSDPALEALARHLPLPLTDLMQAISLTKTDRGLTLEAEGSAILIAQVNEDLIGGSYFFRNQVPESEEKNVLAYERRSGAQVAENCASIYWKGDNRRLEFVPAKPSTISVSRGEKLGWLQCSIPFEQSLDINLVFESFVRESQSLLSKAEDAEAKGDLGKSLDLYQEVIQSKPFHEPSLAKAQTRRSKLLAGARDRIQAVDLRFQEASELGYIGLLQEVMTQAREIEDDYNRHPQILAALANVRGKVDAQLASLQKASIENRAENLLEVVTALNMDGNPELANWIFDFVEKRLANTDQVKARLEVVRTQLKKGK